MSLRQEVMSLIMNGFGTAIEMKTSIEGRSVVVNSFIYQGDYFEAFADFGAIKTVQRIPLLDITDFRGTDKGFEIEYEDHTVIYLTKKNA